MMRWYLIFGVALLALGAARAAGPAAEPVTSKAVVKEGLELVVSLPKGTVGAGEELKFAAGFKNVSQNAFSLYNVDWYWAWKVHLEKVGDKGPGWELRERNIGMRTPVATTHEIKAGENYRVEVAIDPAKKFFEYRWLGPVEKTLPVLWELKPGKYRMTVEVTLVEGRERDGAAGPFWKGTVKSEAVELEVGGKGSKPE